MELLCPKHCASPFCQAVCPGGVITIDVGGVYIDSGKCTGCGLCKGACMTFSRDKTLQRKIMKKSSK